MNKKQYEAPKLFTKIYSILWKIPILQYIRILYYFIDWFILLTIKKPHKNINDKKNALIIFNSALGDGIMYLGLVDSYRKIYDKSEWNLTIICQKANEVLFKDKFDNIIGGQFTKSSVNLIERRKIFKEIRKKYYDMVVDPIGTTVCSPNVFSTRAAVSDKKIGLYYENVKNNQCPNWIRNKIYTSLIKINSDGKHRIELYAEFLRKLGDETCVAHPANITFQNTINSKIESKLPKDFYIVYPSASVNAKCWPIDRYAKIIEKIYAKTKLPLVVCGTEHDKENVNKMLSHISGDIHVINIIGETSIKEFIECVGRAKFVITNDTSTYHIAIAKRVKTFILAGGYTFDSFVNYKYSKLGYIDPIIINKEMECYNCELNCKYKVKDVFPCIDEITVEYAWNIIDKNI